MLADEDGADLDLPRRLDARFDQRAEQGSVDALRPPNVSSCSR